mmetsp:Transcript_9287/g.12280  ORF Transcript_9287/g.12280 Transcript_9287/m.12280 type:complete len:81 (-) Transcript_9287:2285-2527(-)
MIMFERYSTLSLKEFFEKQRSPCTFPINLLVKCIDFLFEIVRDNISFYLQCLCEITIDNGERFENEVDVTDNFVWPDEFR